MKEILKLTEDQIKQIADNEECTMLERMLAKAILKDFSKSSLWNLDMVINRAFGKPKESADISVKTDYNVTLNLGK